MDSNLLQHVGVTLPSTLSGCCHKISCIRGFDLDSCIERGVGLDGLTLAKLKVKKE